MRKQLFKWHSTLAIVFMLPVLIICITGSILVFKVEIDSLLRPHHMVVDAPAQARQNLDSLMQTITDTYPDYALAGWELFDDQARSDTAYVIKLNTTDWYKIYIDQYTGQVLSAPATMEHYITDWLLELHYTFLLHFNGTIIGLIIGLLMLFLGVSGIILYRGFWRKLFTLRWHAALRTLLSDMHKFVGILASPIFLVIAFTGVYWNTSILIHEILEHSDGTEHVNMTQALHSPDIRFEDLHFDTTKAIDSFNATYLAIPNEPDMQIYFFGEVQTNNPVISQYASMITYDRHTGERLGAMDIRQASIWNKIDDSTRKLHFGYFAGIWSKIVWCIIGLAPVILAITGVVMFGLRRKPNASRRTQSDRLKSITTG